MTPALKRRKPKHRSERDSSSLAFSTCLLGDSGSCTCQLDRRFSPSSFLMFSFLVQRPPVGARDLLSVLISPWRGRNEIRQHTVATRIYKPPDVEGATFPAFRAGVTAHFPAPSRAGGEQEAILSGEFHEGPEWAGRTADEPWHRSLAPQEQARESFPRKAFHPLPAPSCPKESKSYPGLVPLIPTLNA